MKMAYGRHAILNYSLFLTLIQFSFAALALEFPQSVSKNFIDSYMRANTEFKRSDFPWFEEPNACGQSGLHCGSNNDQLIRDSWGDASFVPACNNHDRCYMTIGGKREDCQNRFRNEMLSSCKNAYKWFNPARPLCLAVAQSYASITDFEGSVSTGWTCSQSVAHRYEQGLADHYETIVRLAEQRGNYHFVMQTATGLGETNDDWLFGLDGSSNLYAIAKNRTGSSNIEVHILSAASNYKEFLDQMPTALGPTDANWTFLVAQNGDLFGIAKAGTSGKTELHVLSAASRYQQFVLQTPTALGVTAGPQWDFSLAANRNLFAIKRGENDKMTEVHVLSASSNYQQFIMQTPSALGSTNGSWSFAVAPDNDDIFAVARAGSSSNTEIHVLAGGDRQYKSFSAQGRTPLGLTDGRMVFLVAPDRRIFCILKNGTGSGMTEAHVLKSN